MDFFEDETIQNIMKILEIFLLIIIIGFLLFDIFFKKEKVINSEPLVKEVTVKQETKKEDVVILPKEYKVDIKGAVKNPGVYTLKEGAIINDLLELSGGLKSGGTVKNINLSKRVEDEMVIYIYTTSELNKLKNNQQNDKECIVTSFDITPCEGQSVIKVTEENNNTSTNSDAINEETNKLININNATYEELMTLSGIGESKAKAIIEYRDKNGGFKTIEEIMSVSGIGEALFAKIKDSITI
jgi:competence protein ComEA